MLFRNLVIILCYMAVFSLPSWYLTKSIPQTVSLAFCLGFMTGLLNEIRHEIIAALKLLKDPDPEKRA